jgi:hypothetical protein
MQRSGTQSKVASLQQRQHMLSTSNLQRADKIAAAIKTGMAEREIATVYGFSIHQIHRAFRAMIRKTMLGR